ncbi:type II toxin-antitoxin system ParD family antitoxin [Winslowiella iniecta]|uniref:type II toxin-antitoxin system ParD family antitoxin n=1 Tax=Winslowiella iniecta TaxID=1560201 RepID=UPI00240A0326|nr:type II toxin-antitoxin system ParD family antitoxin [Winslowiella iniecta]
MVREKQAESSLQQLRDLVAEGLASGETTEWDRNTFLSRVRGEVSDEEQKD